MNCPVCNCNLDPYMNPKPMKLKRKREVWVVGNWALEKFFIMDPATDTKVTLQYWPTLKAAVAYARSQNWKVV